MLCLLDFDACEKKSEEKPPDDAMMMMMDRMTDEPPASLLRYLLLLPTYCIHACCKHVQETSRWVLSSKYFYQF